MIASSWLENWIHDISTIEFHLTAQMQDGEVPLQFRTWYLDDLFCALEDSRHGLEQLSLYLSEKRQEQAIQALTQEELANRYRELFGLAGGYKHPEAEEDE